MRVKIALSRYQSVPKGYSIGAYDVLRQTCYAYPWPIAVAVSVWGKVSGWAWQHLAPVNAKNIALEEAYLAGVKAGESKNVTREWWRKALKELNDREEAIKRLER